MHRFTPTDFLKIFLRAEEEFRATRGMLEEVERSILIGWKYKLIRSPLPTSLTELRLLVILTSWQEIVRKGNEELMLQLFAEAFEFYCEIHAE
jgi:hypothetical protein